jgi:dipeptidyl-peptidase 4
MAAKGLDASSVPGSGTVANDGRAVAPSGTTAVLQAGAARWRLFGEWGGLMGDLSIEPEWLSDGARFAFIDRPADRVALVDPSTGRVTDLFERGALSRAIEATTARAEATGVPFDSFRFFGSDHLIRFEYRGLEWLFDTETLALTRIAPTLLKSEASAKPRACLEIRKQIGWTPVPEVPSPDGRFLATTEGPDLAIRAASHAGTERLTDDGEDLFRWSLSTVRWSPDGGKVLAAKTDWRHVPTIPCVSWLGQNETISFERYPRAGERHETDHFQVIDVISRRRTPLALPIDLERHAVEAIGWLGNDEVILTANDHGGQTLQVLAANVRTGESRLVLQEPYCVSHMLSPAARQALDHPVRGGEQFLWLSERDGWSHLYLYGWDGTLIRQVTSGAYPVEGLVAVDDAAHVVYFLARPDADRPYDTHFCRIALDGSGFEQLTHDPGDHHVRMAPGFGSFLDTHSAVDRPYRTDLRDAHGVLISTLHRQDVSRLEDVGWTAPEEFCVKAADGCTDLYGVLFRPPGFDPTKKYPVVEAIYGGPQSQVHPNSFELAPPKAFRLAGGPRGQAVDYDAWFGYRALRTAQLGFVTLILDARGTPGRSYAFHQLVYGKMGQHEIADHAAAIRELARTKPWMDIDRVGVFGLSWGGYMTLRALLQAPDLYKVGIASASPSGHDDCWGGCTVVHNLPQASPSTYNLGSNLPLADRLAGKLLIIHGTHDTNAPFGSAIKLVDAFARAGKPVDTLFVANMKHVPTGWHAVYINGVQARYLVEHLRPDGIDANAIPLG